MAIHPRAFVVDLFVDLRQGLIFRKIYISKVHYVPAYNNYREAQWVWSKVFLPFKVVWLYYVDHFLLKKIPSDKYRINVMIIVNKTDKRFITNFLFQH